MTVLSQKANLKSDIVFGVPFVKILGIFCNAFAIKKANTKIPKLNRKS